MCASLLVGRFMKACYEGSYSVESVVVSGPLQRPELDTDVNNALLLRSHRHSLAAPGAGKLLAPLLLGS
jgi:hypothetical protein